jgi:hypothetical protein
MNLQQARTKLAARGFEPNPAYPPAPRREYWRRRAGAPDVFQVPSEPEKNYSATITVVGKTVLISDFTKS